MGSYEKKNHALSNFRFSSRKIANSYSAVLTTLIHKDFNERRTILTSAATRLVFNEDNRINHFELSIVAPKDEDPGLNRLAYLRFTGECLLQYRLTKITAEAYKEVSNQKVNENDHCYQLNLFYDNQKLWTERIFEPNPPLYLQDLRKHLHKNPCIVIFIRGGQKVETDFRELHHKLQKDKITKPLLEKRVHGKKDDQPPNYVAEADLVRLSFSAWLIDHTKAVDIEASSAGNASTAEKVEAPCKDEEAGTGDVSAPRNLTCIVEDPKLDYVDGIWDSTTETVDPNVMLKIVEAQGVALQGNGVFARVKFSANPHMSYIEFCFNYSYVNKINVRETDCCTLRLNHQSFATMARSDQLLPAVVRRLLPGVEILEDDRFHIVTMTRIKFEAACTEKIFMDNEEDGRFHSIRSFLSNLPNGCINFLFRSYPFGGIQNYTELVARFAHERTYGNYHRWFSHSPQDHFLNVGNVVPKAKRPTEQMSPRYSFWDWDDYQITYGYGIMQEEECTRSTDEELPSHTLNIRIVEFALADDCTYIAFLATPKESSLRFVTGETLSVNFKPDEEDQTIPEYWSCEVIERLHFAPPNSTTCVLRRPWDPDTEQHTTTGTPFEAVPLTKLQSTDQTKRAILTANPIRVRVRKSNPDTVMRRDIGQLLLLTIASKDHIQDFLLGRYTYLPRVDIFEAIRPRFPDPLAVMSVNNGQRQAVLQAMDAPAGVVNIIGPPGTGKTYTGVQIIQPFLQDDQGQHVIAAFSNANRVRDKLALDISSACKENEKKGCKPKMVVCLHAGSAEEETVMRAAKIARGSREDERLANLKIATKEDKDLLKTLEGAAAIHRHYEEQTKRDWSFVNDIRVKLFYMSLGWWMLVVAGVLDVDSPFYDPRHDQFKTLYLEYAHGRILCEKDMESFIEAKRELCSATLRRADVVCSTISNAASPYVSKAVKPVIILIDESGRVPEPDTWVCWSSYPGAVGRVFLGDPKQFPPTVKSNLASNNMAASLGISLQERMWMNGFPSTNLKEMRRSVPEICDLVNRVSYDGELELGSGTDDLSRPDGVKVKSFNEKTYGKRSAVILLDAIHGKGHQLVVGGSTCNEEQANIACNLAARIVADTGIQPDKITILTPYQAQWRIYNSAKERMGKELGPEYNKLVVAKVDGYQGEENTIVILDLTITDAAGFISEPKRMAVAISRAKDGLYVIRNRDAYFQFSRRARVLGNLMSALAPFWVRVKSPAERKWVQVDKADLA